MKTSGTIILSKEPRTAPKPNNLVPKAARPKRGGVRVQRVDMCREIARAVAAELMRNGNGDSAKRLVLELENGRDGGGWCRAAVESRVEAVVKAHIEKAHLPAPAETVERTKNNL